MWVIRGHKPLIIRHIWPVEGFFLLSVGLATLMVHSLPPVYWSRFSCLCSPEQVCWWHHQIGQFPSAYVPGPDYPAKIETDCWSFPISHAALGTVVTHDTSVPTVSSMIHLFPQSRPWYICSHSLVHDTSVPTVSLILPCSSVPKSKNAPLFTPPHVY